MAEMMAQGKQPEVLFWVGCAGSFDDRAKKITKAFVKILNKANVEFAVLGTEESLILPIALYILICILFNTWVLILNNTLFKSNLYR